MKKIVSFIRIVSFTAALGVTFTAAYADVIALKPAADTYIKGEDPDAILGNEIEMRVRSYDNGETVRYDVAYLKFDLSFLADVKPGATFEIVTQPESALWAGQQVAVYILREVAGNTSPDWDPASLSYNTTGDEFSKPYVNLVDPLNAERVSYLGELTPPTEAGGVASLSGEALDELVSSEYAGDMQFTLLLVPEFLSNRTVEINSSEGGPLSPLLKVPSDTTTISESIVPVDADTWVRIEKTIGEPIDTIISGLVYGDADTTRIRSLDSTLPGGAVREFVTYVRFDLSGIEGSILPGSEFLIIADGLVGWSDTQVKLYGLVPGDGHTPQDWDELTLNWDTLGSEIDISLLGNDYEGADETRIDGPFLMQANKSADLVLSSGIIPISFSGSSVDNFIAERLADNGSVTFVIMNRPDSNRDINFFSKEFSIAGVHPRLTIRTGTRIEPVSAWYGYTVDDQGWVDTMSWLGWVNVTHDPWIWVDDLGKYVYVPMNQMGEGGIWAYVP